MEAETWKEIKSTIEAIGPRGFHNKCILLYLIKQNQSQASDESISVFFLALYLMYYISDVTRNSRGRRKQPPPNFYFSSDDD